MTHPPLLDICESAEIRAFLRPPPGSFMAILGGSPSSLTQKNDDGLIAQRPLRAPDFAIIPPCFAALAP